MTQGKSAPSEILIVDDQFHNRLILQRLLEKRGDVAVCVESGIDALVLLGERSFDLVLLDVMMPEIDGYQVLEEIRRNHEQLDLPVIMVTARGESESIEKALNLGANDYITKPLDLVIVNARIDTQVQLKRAQAALMESQQRYQLAIASTEDGIWDWNLKTETIYFSENWLKILNLTDKDQNAELDFWRQQIHPEDLADFDHFIKDFLAGDADRFRFEYRMIDAYGNTVWVLTRGFGLRDESGELIRLAGAQSNLTQAKAYDPLTGLFSRNFLFEQLKLALGRSVEKRPWRTAALAISIGRWETIREGLSHNARDQLLVEVSRRLLTSVFGKDSVARIGVAEFVLLIEGLSHTNQVIKVIEKIKQQFSKPIVVDDIEVVPALAIGVVFFEEPLATPDTIIRDAYAAMEDARAARDVYQIFDPQKHEHALKSLSLESELRRGIRENQLVLYYQPIVDRETGQTRCCEALVRWNHPTRGLLGPGEFLPMAERSGLTEELGEWVLRRACRDAFVWNTASDFPQPIVVSVNFSADQFLSDQVLNLIDDVLSETGLRPRYLQIELTESTLINDLDRTSFLLKQLHQRGISIALDDFGTGYSSLSYLKKFPVDSLKVDRSFLEDAITSNTGATLMTAIINMAHSLGMKTVCEGVETEAQLNFLKHAGADMFQGFYLSRPAPVNDFVAFTTGQTGGGT
jgi:diguanylate cyclase (GGDEF)-like protein/PAS domain S-box-containing protein